VWFDEATNTVYARTGGTLSSGWARVFPPDFDYANESIEQLPVVALSQEDDSTWSGVYSGLWVVGEYLFKVDGLDENGKLVMGGAAMHTSTVTGTGLPRALPAKLGLHVIGNNRVCLALPVHMAVTLRVYNAQGRLVMTPLHGPVDAGYHNIALGKRHGLHVLRLRAGDTVRSVATLLLP
jgi:hypothetical protein